MDASFCKKCGYNLKEGKNFIERANDSINLPAVFLGLVVSILVLFVGAIFYGSTVVSGFPKRIYVSMVLVAMAFFGGVTASVIGCKNFDEGYANGAFLSLVLLVNLGFLAGILLMVISGITASFSGAFGSTASSVQTSTTGGSVLDGLLNMVELLVAVISVFIAGIAGGASGVFIKDGLKGI